MQKIYKPLPKPAPNPEPRPRPPSEGIIRPRPIRPYPIDPRPRPPVIGRPIFGPYKIGGALKDYLTKFGNPMEQPTPLEIPEELHRKRPQDDNLQMSNLEQEPEQNRFNALKNLLIK